jgi:hypothetical protein
LFVCFVLWVPKHIYLWRKVVCLFCFVCTDEIHPTRMLQIAFLVSLESSWHLSMKEGCLFVLFRLYWWDPPNQDASDCVLGLFGKLLMRRGALALVS